MSSHPTSIWKRSPNKLRQGEIWLECFCFISLFLAALVLFLVNLGNLPLIDLKEGVVAQVAKEIYQGLWLGDNWLFPTLWGEPYLEQPTLVHDLIAIAYKVAGVSEFTTRLPGALLGAVSVLLLYNIGREIFVARLPALFSALVYLTCLPVLRLSRLAMLDGPLLCFELLTIWAILRSRRDFRWSLLAGIGLGLMALTKGILSLQILVIAIVFLLWDTPRLLASTYYWAGIILGTAPAIAWYVSQWFRYHEFKTTGDFFQLFLGDISASTIQVQLFPEYYLLSGLQYLLPWLVVMAMGLKLISLNLQWGWGKLLITWIGIYTLLSLLVFSQGYWSILPLYPALALAAGRQLDMVRNVPSYIAYPRIWIYSFMLMAAVAAFAGLYWGIRDYVDFYLPFICGSLAITFTVTAIAIAQREKQFVPLLFWGLFISMFLLIISPHWIWEINAKEPIEPIATLIRNHTPAETIIYTSMPQERPSLNFYSDRKIVTQSLTQLKQTWQQNYPVYLLIDPITLEKLDLSQQTVVKSSKFESLKWVLAIKNS
ncbi:ArnT family glycosyltransferase [Pleurocapsa sp. FMAR1]|uniref:ArnT family glycosyltransferase n=1 Tax=Pleurocapsa sp. FMAR1 TaxID=3040204 RepID=UPI0029C7C9DA|nr:glycosyltransferase family 39 protein [Pleurocapsa sp. FMAR1]